MIAAFWCEDIIKTNIVANVFKKMLDIEDVVDNVGLID